MFIFALILINSVISDLGGGSLCTGERRGQDARVGLIESNMPIVVFLAYRPRGLHGGTQLSDASK